MELELAECIGCLVSVVMERAIRKIKDGSAIRNIIAALTILLITLERHNWCRRVIAGVTNLVINNYETAVEIAVCSNGEE